LKYQFRILIKQRTLLSVDFIPARMNSTFQKGGVEEPSYPQLDLSGKLIIKVCLMFMFPLTLRNVPAALALGPEVYSSSNVINTRRSFWG
jgi:hypothetical protein